MGHGIPGLAALLLGGELLAWTAAGASQTIPRLPSNLDVDPALQAFVDRMWEASPTFRRQCRRLGADRHVHVRLLVEDLTARVVHFNARTTLTHRSSALASAHVHVRPSPEAPELIAHELEHVIEQLDGVDLQARAGTAAVWKSGRDSFETRRAIEVGRRVAREVTIGVDTARVSHPAPVVPSGGLLTMAQRDRDGGPASASSARVSASGRHVAFVSLAQLVGADRNQLADVYVLDLRTGQLTLESIGTGHMPANGWSERPDISADGRYVVFASVAGNLAGAIASGGSHVYLRDRTLGTTHLLSVNRHGEPANGASRNPAISADGSGVVFESAATDLLESAEQGDGAGIYLVQLASGYGTRVDVRDGGLAQHGHSSSPAISSDGRFVAFASTAGPPCHDPARCGASRSGTQRTANIYVRDTHTAVTTRIPQPSIGGDPGVASYHPSISADGRYVSFVSEGFVPGRHGGSRAAQVYLHDRETGVTELVSRRSDGRAADGPSRFPAISGDGSVVAFQSLASDLTCTRRCAPHERDINLTWDVFVFHRQSGRMARASRDAAEEWMAPSRAPSLDHCGGVLAFSSRHPIDDDDDGADDDLYVWSTGGSLDTSWTSVLNANHRER